MRMISTARRLLIAAYLAVGLAELSAQPDANSAGLQTEAKSAWSKYDAKARQLSYRITLQSGSGKTTPPKINSFASYRILINANCVSIDEALLDSAGGSPDAAKHKARIYGSDYEFTAERSPGSAEWALTSFLERKALLEAKARNEINPNLVSLRTEVEREYILAGTTFRLLSVRDMIDQPCCKTTRFERLSASADAPVEWVFTIDEAKRPETVVMIASGRIVFDPTRYWVITRRAVSYRNGIGGLTLLDSTITYDTAADDIPVVKTIVTNGGADDGSVIITSRVDYELLPNTPTDADFTLAAYGIPEIAREQKFNGGIMITKTGEPLPLPGPPVGEQTPLDAAPMGWYLPVLIGGCLLIVVALGIRLVAARRRRAA